MTDPRLETERLILRPVDPDRDFEAWAELMTDEETVRYIGGKTLDRAQAWRQMATVIGHWKIRGYGFFSVEEKASGRWIGRAGPWFPEGWPEPEIGWTLARPFWGRGYATEAARAALNFAYEDLGWIRVIHIILKGNIASEAVARKIGSSHETDLPGLPGITNEVISIFSQERGQDS